nr:MauE/DoxX family redox-associated membrane protein [uncultured Rhodococcus sp.]
MLWAVVSSAVGAILVVAGLPKIKEPERMARAVRGYRLLPEKFAGVVGRVLPVAEVAVGLALIIGVLPKIAGGAAVVMFLAFFFGLTVNLLRGRRDLDCGCFAFAAGADEVARIGWWHSARAAVLAVLAATVVLTPTIGMIDRVAGTLVGLFVVGLVCVGVYARTFMSFGRRPIDGSLTNASMEMRAAASVSRY